jgi:selenocysteine-specific elongation factor
MQHVVYGTAGHIDHGKTALIRALTGTDCDRLPEEQSRGITIDLGFAALEAADLRLHFVDVPGHERLVHTMIAGAAGLDLALLVVAADESVMPQTREHLEVIRLMGVPAGAVALTKVDLVDEELVELVAEEVRDLLADTPFAGAPVVPVSARSRQGLDELQAVLLERARSVRPRQLEGRPFRQAVDRVFTLPGAGTVVTGTSLWGRLEVGREVVLQPSGRSVRVRRLHVRGEQRDAVEAGERVGINLAGLSTDAVARGDQVLSPGPWTPTRLATVRLELIEASTAPLDEGDRMEVHVHGARVPAQVVRLVERPLPPGGRCAAQVALERPAMLFPGDRFVVRRPAPVNTFAGGVVLDPHRERVRRAEAVQLAAIPGPEAEQWPQLLASWVAAAGAAATTPDALAARLGVHVEAVEAPLGRLVTAGEVVTLPGRPPRLVRSSVLQGLAERGAEVLERRLSGEVISTGVPARDFAAEVLGGAAAQLADLYLEELRQRGVVELVEGRVVPPGRAEHATEVGKELARRVERLYRDEGLEAPSPAEVAQRLEAKPATVEGICRYLVERGRLVRLEGGKLLLHRATLDGVVRSIREWGVDEFSVPEFKDRFGLSRKLAIPILEWLDSERVTLRHGSSRRVRGQRAPTGGP